MWGPQITSQKYKVSHALKWTEKNALPIKPGSLNISAHTSRCDRISFKHPTFFFPPKLTHLSHHLGGVLGFCSEGYMIIILPYFSSKGLPSSSTFTLEEGTIYLTSEANALEMQDDNASVLDVYLVSNTWFLPLLFLLFYKWIQALAHTRTNSVR